MIDAGFHDVLGQVKRLLQESPFPSIRLLEVEVEGELFRLQGSVDSYYLKQIAQETVRSVVRSAELLNDIHVTTDAWLSNSLKLHLPPEPVEPEQPQSKQ